MLEIDSDQDGPVRVYFSQGEGAMRTWAAAFFWLASRALSRWFPRAILNDGGSGNGSGTRFYSRASSGSIAATA